ncbi:MULTISPECIES: PEP-CTERM sorting domain-containing protein [unclassified Microcoleus]|uniref:PEP-CTERM sorting domain-containing protein n=1 Tax=unclassified Microcoleus TaxID=2642155 RepID=UPI002FD074D3
MCTLLAKLAIGLSATMATAFYYLAAAPPASAAIDVCGPGNFSDQCVKGQQSTSTSSSTSLRDSVPEPQLATPDPVTEPQVVEPQLASPDPVTEPQVVEPQLASPDPVPQESPVVLQSPAPTPEPVAPTPPVELPLTTPEPTEQLPDVQLPAIGNPIVSPSPIVAPTPTFPDIYQNPATPSRTAIPEPGTVVALLLTGAGIICSGRKRNKQVGQQR